MLYFSLLTYKQSYLIFCVDTKYRRLLAENKTDKKLDFLAPASQIYIIQKENLQFTVDKEFREKFANSILPEQSPIAAEEDSPKTAEDQSSPSVTNNSSKKPFKGIPKFLRFNK